MAARADGATPSEAFEGLRGFDQMVVFELAFLGRPVLPHMVSNLVAGSGRSHDGLRIQLTDAPGREDGGVHAVRREEFEEAPDADASAKFAFGELHGRLVTDTPQEHGVEVNGQVHGHTYARRVSKALKVHMSRAIALGSLTEFLEFMLHCTGHLDLSFGQSTVVPSRDCVGRTCVLTHARAGSPSPSSYVFPEPIDQTTGPVFARRHRIENHGLAAAA